MTLDFDVKIINRINDISCDLENVLAGINQRFFETQENYSNILGDVENVENLLNKERKLGNIESKLQDEVKILEENRLIRSNSMTTDKMNDIVKILGTQKRLENENFEIYRFGTIEFNNIGKFEPTQEIVNHESKITPQTSAGSIPESQFTEISEQTKISKFSEESFKAISIVQSENSDEELKIDKLDQHAHYFGSASETSSDILENHISNEISELQETKIESENFVENSVVPKKESEIFFQKTPPMNFIEELNNKNKKSESVSNTENFIAQQSPVKIKPPMNFIDELRNKKKILEVSDSDEETDKVVFLNKSRVMLGRKRRPPSRKKTILKNVEKDLENDFMKKLVEKQEAEINDLEQIMIVETKLSSSSSDIDTDELFE